jgi:GNAT superfamily N-acetyltransferase
MDGAIAFRYMEFGEESEVFELISRVFNEFVAPGYSNEGIEEFMKYAQPEELAGRLKEDQVILVAELGSEIIGVIDILNCSHVALLFVDARFQRRGIGKELLRKALEICRQEEPSLSKVTVNSSPNAVTAYEKIGFEPTDIEQCVNGIRFVPMSLNVTGGDSG